MKICVISFDFWQYDAHIVEELCRKGIEAQHLNIGAYQHKNIPARIKNTLSKVILKRNLKNELRQKMMLEKLQKLGTQDQILVINPELIDRKFHEEIRKFTPRYIAYLYDSLARCPAEHLFDLFDEVFSFDQNNAHKHGFQLITNYNYLPENKIKKEAQFDLVYLASFDNRRNMVDQLLQKMHQLDLTSQIFIVGKKSWKKKWSLNKSSSIIYKTKRIPHDKIPDYYKKGKVLLDLMRDNQTGLSFRIFEAMALKKKIITNNPTIKEYDFYNPDNILVLNEALSNLNRSFFEEPYQELAPEIYRKYTLENWVKTVFNL